MIYKNLGNTGLKVSVLSYGSWVSFDYQVGVQKAVEIMGAAMKEGVNFFDNAEVYAHGKSEEIMGEAIKQMGCRREDLVISTKIYWGPSSPGVAGTGPNDKGVSRKRIIEGLRASLKRLQMDYVDVVFCHRPDPDTPIEETVRAMNWVIDQGWAFYWGTSEWNGQQLQEAWTIADKLGLIGPCCEQPEYNLLKREKVEKDYLPLYRQYGLGLTTWSPLASGFLTGKYSGGKIPEGSRAAIERYRGMFAGRASDLDLLNKIDKMKPIADKLECTMAQLALAWCISNPHVSTVITGASRVEQVHENMKALEIAEKLTPEIKSELDDLYKSKPEDDPFMRK